MQGATIGPTSFRCSWRAGACKHGQAVGSTDANGYDVKSGLVPPQDIAATVFRHLGIDLGAHGINPLGRPMPIVVVGGRPMPELM